MPRLSLLAATAGCAALAQPAPAETDPCPLRAPDGGYTSFVAWTGIFNAQPHHVASPFKHDLVPPVMMPSFCSADSWSSSNWNFLGMRGSDWMATPKTAPPSFIVGSEACSQTLTGIGVFTAIQSHAALRLHYAGCGKPETVVAMRLENDTKPSTGTGEPAVLGVGLLPFMCKISPAECAAAKERVQHSGHAQVGDVQLTKGTIGLGRCSGYGVVPHEVPAMGGPTSSEACAAVCLQRIQRNRVDPSQGSCRGYAWSASLMSCIVYDGWRVTEVDPTGAAKGYVCENISFVGAQAPAPSPSYLQDTSASVLELQRVFSDPRAVTARRIQVTPFEKACFAPFDWYIIDRWVNVPVDDYQVILEMTRTNVSANAYLFSHPSHGGHAPRANLMVERACIRDCTGALRAECMAEAKMAPVPPPGYTISVDGRFVGAGTAEASSAPESEGSFFDFVMGHPAAAVFTDPESVQWVALTMLVSTITGFAGTLFIGQVWHKHISSNPTYHSPEEVKLVYEGDEEETVALRPDGNLATLAGGVAATWVPKKATSSAFGSMLAPFSTH